MSTALQKQFTSAEVAELLNITDGYVRQLCSTHKNIGSKFGRQWSFSRADIKRLEKLLVYSREN